MHESKSGIVLHTLNYCFDIRCWGRKCKEPRIVQRCWSNRKKVRVWAETPETSCVQDFSRFHPSPERSSKILNVMHMIFQKLRVIRPDLDQDHLLCIVQTTRPPWLTKNNLFFSLLVKGRIIYEKESFLTFLQDSQQRRTGSNFFEIHNCLSCSRERDKCGCRRTGLFGQP